MNFAQAVAQFPPDHPIMQLLDRTLQIAAQADRICVVGVLPGGALEISICQPKEGTQIGPVGFFTSVLSKLRTPAPVVDRIEESVGGSEGGVDALG